MSELIEYIRNCEREYLQLLRELIELESPTHDKRLVDLAMDRVERFFREQKARVRRLPQREYGDNLLAEWGEGEEQMLFIGHIDTVWEQGTLERMPFSIENGVLRGPGCYDMKAGVVQGLYALKVMNDLGISPGCRIVFLINSDEEIGSPGSRSLIEEQALKSMCALVAEGPVPPDGRLKIERKGCGFFEMTIRGIAAHAGVNPQDGASAIHEFARQVQYLESLADPAKGTTINVGYVQGGTRANVVAERLTAKIDLRVRTMAEAERVVPLIQGLKPADPRTVITVEGELNRPPMERTAGNMALFRKAQALAAELGFELKGESTGGMSDANLTSALGVPTIDGLGAVGAGGHSEDEHVLIAHMPERIALLVRLFSEIGAGGPAAEGQRSR